jgi:hypothetical protein
MLFATNKLYGDNVLKIKKGDLLFLVNLDTDILYGSFRAKSDGGRDLIPEAWKGKYPYQVKVQKNGKAHSISEARKIISQIGPSWHDPLDSDRALTLSRYLENPDPLRQDSKREQQVRRRHSRLRHLQHGLALYRSR